MDMDKSDQKVKVYYLSLRADTPCNNFWDYSFIHDLLKDFDFEEVNQLPDVDCGIVVIPARSHDKLINEINKELSKLKGVVLMLLGDEENVFPVEKIKHQNIKIWIQNPHPERHDSYRKLGTGYTPHIKEFKPKDVDKTLDFFFAGQVTHSRREECVAQLRHSERKGVLIESKGFTQGILPKDYVETMAIAKVCPCPSGPQTPDSFRLFESLELGCVPVADTQTPKEDWEGFWEWLFEEPVPFPTIKNWESLPSYIADFASKYPAMNNDIQAWWQRYKNKMLKTLIADVRAVGGTYEVSPITVIVPVSPIPSHPNTHILDETISTIRFHLPKVEIIVTFDGVREEQKDRTDDYNEHIRRFLWKYSDDLRIRPFIYKEHKHQIGMARDIIDKIDTPLILYVEQDTPLVLDYPIEWDKIQSFILSGESNLVRFHFEAFVPKEHKHLMIGEPENGFLKTVQWSQRPHLSSTAFYKRILSENFSSKAKCFIEDLAHGKVIESFNLHGVQGWNQWRLHIYHPDGVIKRSYNLDGRANSNKFDTTQVF